MHFNLILFKQFITLPVVKLNQKLRPYRRIRELQNLRLKYRLQVQLMLIILITLICWFLCVAGFNFLRVLNDIMRFLNYEGFYHSSLLKKNSLLLKGSIIKKTAAKDLHKMGYRTMSTLPTALPKNLEDVVAVEEIDEKGAPSTAEDYSQLSDDVLSNILSKQSLFQTRTAAKKADLLLTNLLKEQGYEVVKIPKVMLSKKEFD